MKVSKPGRCCGSHRASDLVQSPQKCNVILRSNSDEESYKKILHYVQDDTRMSF